MKTLSAWFMTCASLWFLPIVVRARRSKVAAQFGEISFALAPELRGVEHVSELYRVYWKFGSNFKNGFGKNVAFHLLRAVWQKKALKKLHKIWSRRLIRALMKLLTIFDTMRCIIIKIITRLMDSLKSSIQQRLFCERTGSKRAVGRRDKRRNYNNIYDIHAMG